MKILTFEMVFRKRVIKKKSSAPKAKKVTAAQVKKIMLRNMETKRFSFSSSRSGMLANTAYGENLLYWIQQGSTDSQRIGDSIYLSKIRINGAFKVDTVQEDVVARIMILASQKETFTGTTGFSLGLNSAIDPRLIAPGSWVSNPIVDENNWKVLYSKQIDLPMRVIGASFTRLAEWSAEINIGRDFNFGAGNFTYAGMKNHNYYVYVVYDSPSGGLSTCSAQIAGVVEFKDA